MARLFRFLLVLTLAVGVPFQGVLALSAAPDLAVEQCHDGHEDHGKVAESHCAACFAPAAIANPIEVAMHSPGHGLVHAAPDLPHVLPPPSGIDRPPQLI